MSIIATTMLGFQKCPAPSKSLFTKKEFQKKSNCSPAVIKSLEKKEILLIQSKDISRLEFSSDKNEEFNQLNELQLEAFNKIKTEFKEKATVLLHGVTSSGNFRKKVEDLFSLL